VPEALERYLPPNWEVGADGLPRYRTHKNVQVGRWIICERCGREAPAMKRNPGKTCGWNCLGIKNPCSINGCDRPRRSSRGWCKVHYNKWLRHGDPLVTLPPGVRPSEVICSVEGCEERSKARGMCHRHWSGWSTTGDPLEPVYKGTQYGLSWEQYQEMLAAQDGRCAICRGLPTGKRLHIDHNHDTGEVRGLLCGLCNLLLGNAGDSADRLLVAADYLKERSSGR